MSLRNERSGCVGSLTAILLLPLLLLCREEKEGRPTELKRECLLLPPLLTAPEDFREEECVRARVCVYSLAINAVSLTP